MKVTAISLSIMKVTAIFHCRLGSVTVSFHSVDNFSQLE